MSGTTGSVRIRLTTRDNDIKVDDSPIYVPVSLKRYGLSEIVNKLLDTVEPVPFDFLIDGKLLRTTLDSYLTSEGLSQESVVTIEYVRSILPPTFLASFEHDDWVSAVHGRNDSIATGSYDGVVRIWDASGNIKTTLAGHTGAVKAVKWIGDHRLISGSNDRNVYLWKLDDADEAKIQCIFQGHHAAVNDVVNLKSDKIVSASSDNSLRVWTTHLKELPMPEKEPDSKNKASVKRRKLADAAVKSQRVRGSLLTLNAHTAPVTGVSAHAEDPQVVYSCSEDHSIRTWDLVTGQLVDTKSSSFSLLSIANLGTTTSLIACGTTARHIVLTDPRATVKTSQNTLVGHRNFVSSLVASPSNPYQLASASHDGTVRIWDVRANKSLFIIEQQEQTDNDLFCVDWATNLTFGGKTKKLQINQANEQ